MKTLNYLILIGALLANTLIIAQNIPISKVPGSVIAAFKAKFPHASKEKWEVENKTEFEVEFKLKGKEQSANFDITGKWIETETELKMSSLPEIVKSAIKSDFPGFKIVELEKIESAINGICYEAEIEKSEEEFEVLYSSNGKQLNKIKIDEIKGHED